MTLKEFVRDFCHFSQRDRIAIFSLLILCAFVWLLPGVFPGKKHIDKSSTAEVNFSDEDTIVKVREWEEGSSKSIHLFAFDPNKLDLKGWMELGVKEKTALTIQKYITKGGKFRKKEDLQKIWGLRAEDYERIAPFVRIEAENIFIHADTGSRPVYKKYSPPSVPVIDINMGDTTAFIALPGIGSKLANRIITFREKLGGFYSIDQVSEVYGLSDTTFQKIRKWLKVENPVLRKININTATNDELKSHPYIRWNLAKLIIAYRTEHGPFQNIEELKNIMGITEEVFEKMKPYLILN